MQKNVILEPKSAALKVVKCECGMEILVIPDLREMGKAIEAHVREHCKREKDATKAASEFDRICTLLFAAVFDVAAYPVA